MSLHPAISSLVTYGYEGEDKLTSAISQCLGEQVIKTASAFDSMDFGSPTYFVELKRRGLDWTYHDTKIKEEGWFMPSCKVIKGWEEISKGKRVFFFYFWSFDKTLWSYEMSATDFTQKDDHFVPKNHYDTMLHVTIPQDKWTFVEKISSIVFEEETCWIE